MRTLIWLEVEVASSTVLEILSRWREEMTVPIVDLGFWAKEVAVRRRARTEKRRAHTFSDASRNALYFLHQQIHKLVIDGFVKDEPCTGDAGLAGCNER